MEETVFAEIDLGKKFYSLSSISKVSLNYSNAFKIRYILLGLDVSVINEHRLQNDWLIRCTRTDVPNVWCTVELLPDKLGSYIRML